MDTSGGRLNTYASNDNTNGELNWPGLLDFNNGFESLNQLFDSPSFLFNSDIVSSPSTTGNYFGYDPEERKKNVSDIKTRSLTSPISISINKMEESMKSELLDWNYESQLQQIDFSMQISKIEPQSVQSPQKDCKFDQIQASKEQSRYEDGYHWRKYGQKQVKGDKQPRSYFKCSYPNCPTKKKVEKDLNGYITEVIYKGKHTHPMPQNLKKSSLNSFQNTISDPSIEKQSLEPVSASSLASFMEDEYEQDFPISKSCNDHENEPIAKRWKTDDVESEAISYGGSKGVQQPRVVIETKSEIDILDDGYKWRKYGQKVVKGNHNPRSYYKCTYVGCPVRKLVERASHDLHSVITTYESKHNHDVPSRGSGSYATNRLPKFNTTLTSNNYMPEKSKPIPNNLYNVHGMRGWPNDNGQTSIGQKLEEPKGFGFMGSSYLNQDWMRGQFLSKTKEESENDFIYKSS